MGYEPDEERRERLFTLGGTMQPGEDHDAFVRDNFDTNETRWVGLVDKYFKSDEAWDDQSLSLIQKLLNPYGVLYNGTVSERRELATDLFEQLTGQTIPEWAIIQAMHTVKQRQQRGEIPGSLRTQKGEGDEPQNLEETFDPELDEKELKLLILNEKLMFAVECGDGEEVERLLLGGADPDFYDAEWCDMRPLHRAADLDQVEVMRTLLEHGATVNAPDIKNRTALHMAAAAASVECVQTLLAAGGKVDAEDEESRQPIHVCAGRGNVACLKLLLDAGADVNARNHIGDTPLLAATVWGEVAAMTLLLDNGADGNATNLMFATPLAAAKEFAFKDAETLLLSRGVCAYPLNPNP
ncbi:ankyrin repeat-containing domain protein [Baffinella frigidus]|nr:ankyrin repeat-containing domain protein [Cryptophyta sp. CCMP2293]